mmetsp:Transcript_16704/g.35482  ORF Transcript_16704/g.35482 Transcript_16704/m.35482 type:complete len:231 (-) Transcript_16704:622-1314(-)
MLYLPTQLIFASALLLSTLQPSTSFQLSSLSLQRASTNSANTPLPFRQLQDVCMCAEQQSTAEATSTESKPSSEFVGTVTPTQRKPPAPKPKTSSKGIFAPAVLQAKKILGENELNQLRGKVIAEHSKVISAFVDTSESPFGRIALKRLFDAADKDGNGTLDRQEIEAALRALGFTYLNEKQIDGIFTRADIDENEEIDFEEFCKEAPKTLRTNLIKLAKTNGHDLGFLA